MSQGTDLNAPAVVEAFHSALRHQALLVLLVVALVPVAWHIWRWRAGPVGTVPTPEAPGRRALRLAFGSLWVLDGLLQLQQSMPLGLVPKVIQPAAASSPGWVQALVGGFTGVWDRHPVVAAAATVWVQTGLGAWMLAANRGAASRLAGVAAAGWAAVVWVGGNAFGGIFGSGLSWLTGAPGAVLLYAVAGALVALPEGAWRGARLGRLLTGGLGLYLLGFAVLQAWPGRGSWRGGQSGSLSSFVAGMAGTPQPGWLHAAVSGFADLTSAHGWAVNLAVVVALASCGAGLLAGTSARRLRPLLDVAAAGTVVLCMADWVLVQDLGFLGGVGTDPNSMLPTAAVVAGAWLAVRRAAAPAPAGVTALPAPGALAGRASPWWQVAPGAALRLTASAGAVVVILVGALPLTAAAAEPHADPILTTALDGPATAIDSPAHPFSLVDQDGRPVSLASLRGRTIALTFLDPVCPSDCPVLAKELAQTESLVAQPSRTAFVAVDVNPHYLGTAYLRAFDAEQDLGAVPGWHYLTGSLPALRQVWGAYGAYAQDTPGGGMVAHNDIAYVIGPDGRLHYVLDANPGPATAATESSFAVTLAGAMRHVLGGAAA